MNRFLRAAGGVLATLLLVIGPGCATAPEEPVMEVGLADLRFTHVTVFETTAELDIRLENLMPEAVQVTGGSHKVTVNGVSLGRGVTGEALPLARLGTGVQRVEFHLRNLSMARSIQDLGRNRVIDYDLESTLYVARPGSRDRTVRVHRSGQLDLNRGPRPTMAPGRLP